MSEQGKLFDGDWKIADSQRNQRSRGTGIGGRHQSKRAVAMAMASMRPQGEKHGICVATTQNTGERESPIVATECGDEGGAERNYHQVGHNSRQGGIMAKVATIKTVRNYRQGNDNSRETERETVSAMDIRGKGGIADLGGTISKPDRCPSVRVPVLAD